VDTSQIRYTVGCIMIKRPFKSRNFFTSAKMYWN